MDVHARPIGNRPRSNYESAGAAGPPTTLPFLSGGPSPTKRRRKVCRVHGGHPAPSNVPLRGESNKYVPPRHGENAPRWAARCRNVATHQQHAFFRHSCVHSFGGSGSSTTELFGYNNFLTTHVESKHESVGFGYPVPF